MRRRTLLWLSALLPGLGLCWPGAAASGGASALASLFRHPRAAARLGEHCLRAPSLARAPAALLADLGAAVQPNGQICAERFERQRQQDFATGRIAVVGGWVMARCEVSACMLLARAIGARA